MGIAIHTIPLGFDNTYIVKDQGTIMIDSGEPKESKAFIIGIKSFNDFMKRAIPISLAIFVIKLIWKFWQEITGFDKPDIHGVISRHLLQGESYD